MVELREKDGRVKNVLITIKENNGRRVKVKLSNLLNRGDVIVRNADVNPQYIESVIE